MDESSRGDRIGRQGQQRQGEPFDAGDQFAAGDGEQRLEPQEPGRGRRYQGDVQSLPDGAEDWASSQVNEGGWNGAAKQRFVNSAGGVAMKTKLLAVGVLLTAIPAWAHHGGTSLYDMS